MWSMPVVLTESEFNGYSQNHWWITPWIMTLWRVIFTKMTSHICRQYYSMNNRLVHQFTVQYFSPQLLQRRSKRVGETYDWVWLNTWIPSMSLSLVLSMMLPPGTHIGTQQCSPNRLDILHMRHGVTEPSTQAYKQSIYLEIFDY